MTGPRAATRRLYLAANVFELFLCLAAAQAAIGFLADPESLQQTAIGQTLHPYDYVWNIGYGVGAIVTLIGLIRMSVRFEAAGLWLLAASVAINGIAIFYVAGRVGLNAGLVTAAFGLACLGRLHYVTRMARQ